MPSVFFYAGYFLTVHEWLSPRCTVSFFTMSLEQLLVPKHTSFTHESLRKDHKQTINFKQRSRHPQRRADIHIWYFRSVIKVEFGTIAFRTWVLLGAKISCESLVGSESSRWLLEVKLSVLSEKAGPCWKVNKSLHLLLTSAHGSVSCIIRTLWSGRYKALFARGPLSLQHITLLQFRYACSKIFFFCSLLWIEKFKILEFVKVHLICNKNNLLQEISVSSSALLSWEFLLLINVCRELWRWRH